MSDPRDQVIERLEVENDTLRARIEELEVELHWTGLAFPIEWRLTPSEAKVLGALAAREACTKEYIHSVLYSFDIDGGAEIKIVDVFICKMRKKLTPYGIEITTRWGAGYCLKSEARTRVKSYLIKQAA